MIKIFCCNYIKFQYIKSKYKRKNTWLELNNTVGGCYGFQKS